MAIAGQGFFTVKDPSTGTTYATRDGSFQVDNSGYLITSTGLRLQGFSDAGLTTRGDLKLDAAGAPASAAAGASLASFQIDRQGRAQVVLDDGTAFTRGQVLLQNFASPTALSKEGNNLYSNLAAAGPLAQTLAPASNGLGGIEAGSLEMSNVDLASEFSNLILAQRGFQANSRIITTSDEVMQEIINLKR
jgi:flagellar hook protein FlgE